MKKGKSENTSHSVFRTPHSALRTYFHISPFALRKIFGYTLVEAASVLLITSAITLIAFPIAVDNVNRGKLTQAEGTVRGIGTVITTFFTDTQEWPDRRSNNEPDFYEILRSGREPGDEMKDPYADTTQTTLITAAGQSWFPLGDETRAGSSEMIGNFNEHLVSGKVPPPNVVVSDLALLPLTYKGWSGPYIAVVDQDPWDRNYLVYVRALTRDKDRQGKQVYAWVLSAGPDKVLSTKPLDVKPIGDDVGILMLKKEKHPTQ